MEQVHSLLFYKKRLDKKKFVLKFWAIKKKN